MDKQKKLTLVLFLAILSLILREMPYINIFVVRQLWLFYPFLLFFLIFPLPIKAFILSLVFVFFAALILTYLKLTYFAELTGVLIYFLLWIIWFLKIKDYFQKMRK